MWHSSRLSPAATKTCGVRNEEIEELEVGAEEAKQSANDEAAGSEKLTLSDDCQRKMVI